MKLIGRVCASLLSPEFSGMQLPTPRVIDHEHVQVFYATRLKGRSQIRDCVIRIDKTKDTLEVVEVSKFPTLLPGEIGTYSQDGIHPSSIIVTESKILMFTIGWIQGKTPPLFSASIGLAESINGKDFVDIRKAPIMDRSIFDRTLVTSPTVARNVDTGYLMYYTSGTDWITNSDNSLQSRYHIKSAFSTDGIEWTRKGDVVIDYWDEITNIARPAIWNNEKFNRLLFSYFDKRIGHYQLGVSQFENGIWSKIEASSIFGPIENTQCASYPAVFKMESSEYLVINGIDRGSSGFSVYRFDS